LPLVSESVVKLHHAFLSIIDQPRVDAKHPFPKASMMTTNPMESGVHVTRQMPARVN
jgi:hypothetical protein